MVLPEPLGPFHVSYGDFELRRSKAPAELSAGNGGHGHHVHPPLFRVYYPTDGNAEERREVERSAWLPHVAYLYGYICAMIPPFSFFASILTWLLSREPLLLFLLSPPCLLLSRPVFPSSLLPCFHSFRSPSFHASILSTLPPSMLPIFPSYLRPFLLSESFIKTISLPLLKLPIPAHSPHHPPPPGITYLLIKPYAAIRCLPARPFISRASLLRHLNHPHADPTTSGGENPEGRLPVVLFSHGLWSMRSTYTQFCFDLASHGYGDDGGARVHGRHSMNGGTILLDSPFLVSLCTTSPSPSPQRTVVVAPEYTDGSACMAAETDGEEEEEGGAGRRKGREALRSILALLHQFNKGHVSDSRNAITSAARLLPSSLAGRLDLSHIALAGHSFGGATAAFLAGVAEQPINGFHLSLSPAVHGGRSDGDGDMDGNENKGPLVSRVSSVVVLDTWWRPLPDPPTFLDHLPAPTFCLLQTLPPAASSALLLSIHSHLMTLPSAAVHRHRGAERNHGAASRPPPPPILPLFSTPCTALHRSPHSVLQEAIALAGGKAALLCIDTEGLNAARNVVARKRFLQGRLLSWRDRWLQIVKEQAKQDGEAEEKGVGGKGVGTEGEEARKGSGRMDGETGSVTELIVLVGSAHQDPSDLALVAPAIMKSAKMAGAIPPPIFHRINSGAALRFLHQNFPLAKKCVSLALFNQTRHLPFSLSPPPFHLFFPVPSSLPPSLPLSPPPVLSSPLPSSLPPSPISLSLSLIARPSLLPLVYFPQKNSPLPCHSNTAYWPHCPLASMYVWHWQRGVLAGAPHMCVSESVLSSGEEDNEEEVDSKDGWTRTAVRLPPCV
ncbi:unnamed protein product [Closterium sp. Naga37s-1]|nr:unnamed protein product [Closterium sp. Naga37s-1]